MSGFSNFAVSFTIISVLSGCLTLYYFGCNLDGRPLQGREKAREGIQRGPKPTAQGTETGPAGTPRGKKPPRPEPDRTAATHPAGRAGEHDHHDGSRHESHGQPASERSETRRGRGGRGAWGLARRRLIDSPENQIQAVTEFGPQHVSLSPGQSRWPVDGAVGAVKIGSGDRCTGPSRGAGDTAPLAFETPQFLPNRFWAQFVGISAGSSGVPTSGSSSVLTGPVNVRLAPASQAIQTPSARAMVTSGA